MNEKSRPQLFDFFSNPRFDICFFSGRNVVESDRIHVFPEWILRRYQLEEQYMGMLNWNRVKYGELFLPCHPEAAEKISHLENTIRESFEAGFDGVNNLDRDLIFLWMSKLLLGILYHDIKYSIELGRKRNKPFGLSPLLTRKYRDLHFMMQKMMLPVRWAVKPYSIIIKKVTYSKDVFNFRDETRNQNFSLGMNGVGLIACLQDRQLNQEYHQDLLEKMGDVPLHAIQFEELCARFIYSNYLLRQQSEWQVSYTEDDIVLSPATKPIKEFAAWEDKMFASVLEDYWKPWGIEPKEIYTFPDSPLSFLINENNNQFIRPEDIPLPS